MTYKVVEFVTGFPTRTEKRVVSKGFACLPSELNQEIATHLGIDIIQLVDVAHYSNLEAAHEIAKAHNLGVAA